MNDLDESKVGRIKRLCQELSNQAKDNALIRMNKDSQDLLFNLGALIGMIYSMLPPEPNVVLSEK